MKTNNVIYAHAKQTKDSLWSILEDIALPFHSEIYLNGEV